MTEIICRVDQKRVKCSVTLNTVWYCASELNMDSKYSVISAVIFLLAMILIADAIPLNQLLLNHDNSQSKYLRAY